MSGYTHEISWKEYNPTLGMFVDKSFKTTPDMVETHLTSLKESTVMLPKLNFPNINSIKATEL